MGCFMVINSILVGLQKEGFQARTVPVDRLPQLREDIETHLRAGQLDKNLNDAYLGFVYNMPEDLPEAKSIIVIAVPQPQIRISFQYKGSTIPMVVPPTYANGAAIDVKVRGILERGASSTSRKFVKTVLPLKTLATRTGLARYGRNNITYVRKHGSFHRLTAFYTDLDLERDDWQERDMLPQCEKCRACLNACPTSAIGEDRFLLRAERCLTYFNEMPSDQPFPSFIDDQTHNCIVGCLRCQRVCPCNREVIEWFVEGEKFSEIDTEYLLQGTFTGDRATEMEKRLASCGLDLTIFPRNLAALLHI